MSKELHDLCPPPDVTKDHQIKDNEMSGICRTYEGRREMSTEFWWESLKERDNLEDLVVDGRIVLRVVLGNVMGAAWRV